LEPTKIAHFFKLIESTTIDRAIIDSEISRLDQAIKMLNPSFAETLPKNLLTYQPMDKSLSPWLQPFDRPSTDPRDKTV
jgi:hypothetical protein